MSDLISVDDGVDHPQSICMQLVQTLKLFRTLREHSIYLQEGPNPGLDMEQL